MQNRKKKRTKNLLLPGLALLYFLPIAVNLYQSLGYRQQRFTYRQYAELFVNHYLYFGYFWNSVGYAVLSAGLGILLAIPISFLFAKFKFRFREGLFFVYIVVLMMPFQAVMLPGYIMFRDMQLLNTPIALILPIVFSPIAVFLLRQFMKEIPDELLDSARLETNSAVKMLRYIVLPQVKPAVVTLFIILFCESWNMVEQAFTYAPRNREIMPLSVMLGELPGEVLAAGSMVYMFPIILLFLLTEEMLYQGMEQYRW